MTARSAVVLAVVLTTAFSLSAGGAFYTTALFSANATGSGSFSANETFTSVESTLAANGTSVEENATTFGAENLTTLAGNATLDVENATSDGLNGTAANGTIVDDATVADGNETGETPLDPTVGPPQFIDHGDVRAGL